MNISSVGGRMAFPLGSLYHGSKFAVEGLSEALNYELAPFGISVKIIEPGLVDTDFAGRSFVLSTGPEGNAYQGVIGAVFGAFAGMQGQGSAAAEDVATAIYDAATDGTRQLRYIVGGDAVATLGARAAMEDVAFLDMMRGNFGLLPDTE